MRKHSLANESYGTYQKERFKTRAAQTTATAIAKVDAFNKYAEDSKFSMQVKLNPTLAWKKTTGLSHVPSTAIAEQEVAKPEWLFATVADPEEGSPSHFSTSAGPSVDSVSEPNEAAKLRGQ